jgi:hypothetical protein
MRRFRLLLYFLAMPSLSQGAVETFVETFNGDGPFQSITNDLVGFDNPGWEVYSDDAFEHGGFHIRNDGEFEEGESDVLERTLSGVGSFKIRVELNDLDLGNFSDLDPPLSVAGFYLNLRLHEDVEFGRNTMGMSISESLAEDPVWWFVGTASGSHPGVPVPRGPRVAMELVFDATASEVTFSYDNDTDDAVDPLQFGPFGYRGVIQETQLLTMIAGSNDAGKFDGVLDYLSITPFSDISGDFSGNGLLDAADIDQLSGQVRTATNDSSFDLNADALVDDLDRQVWVHGLKQTFFGDADLDGSFDGTDLVQVLSSGEYEDGVELNSTWLTGDWDGDGDFTSGDLVVALADGGYEAGAAAVPEPAAVVLTITAAAVVGVWHHRRSKTRRT